MTSTTTLNLGTIGRCACGCIGKRRSMFADEPICDPCLPGRRGFLHVRHDGAPISALVVGQLTSAQRRARVAFLRGSMQREAQLLAERADIVAHARVEHDLRQAEGGRH